LLNEKQMAAAAASMGELWARYPGSGDDHAHAGNGPYSILSTTHGLHGAAWVIRQAALAFPPVRFPYWSPGRTRDTAPTLTGDGAVWVVPGFVRSLVEWHSSDSFQIFENQSVLDLPAPPTDADMASWLATMLTAGYQHDAWAAGRVRKCAPAYLPRAGTVAALSVLGWRAAIQVVLSLPEAGAQTPASVAAVLAGLASAPGLGG